MVLFGMQNRKSGRGRADGQTDRRALTHQRVVHGATLRVGRHAQLVQQRENVHVVELPGQREAHQVRPGGGGTQRLRDAWERMDGQTD
jgi:hypothetical protein